MKKVILTMIVIFTALLSIYSCKQEEKSEAKPVTLSQIDAISPYFTKNGEGNPVICWSERDPKDSLYRLKYAVYDNINHTFGKPRTVPASAGMSTSPESMAKISFKSDHTVIAVFAKKFKYEKNPFAGAIYYSMSFDEGESWSDAQFIHSDTSHTYGRSFFDLTTLKNGEIAAIWLDGRLGKEIEGSALFFSKTEKGKGFSRDTCLFTQTCECCRTAILKDDTGGIHIAFRSIIFPSVLSKKQVRDMVYSCSKDNGKTFTPLKVISNDNWAIEGCPHTGPSLAVYNQGVHAVWFTAGGSSGIYYTYAAKAKNDFKNRTQISTSGRHPQMIANPDGTIAVVYEDNMQASTVPTKKVDHKMSNMMHHEPQSIAKIVLRALSNDKKNERIVIVTDGKQPDHHAVLTSLKNEDNMVLVAWTRELSGHSMVYYSKVKLDE